MRKYEIALEDYAAALVINPEDPVPYLNRSSLYRVLNRLKEANSDIDRVIFLSPGSINGYINRGIILRDRGTLEEAL